ncbi:hypothetical protein VHEMI05677 [[Torrubiella] hemipterigena]|uniref:Elongator complex protein 5 n=1 Tax=[Torrubiella] hemipterigena TaxID=1531966 RepID=A0A0A1T4V3_9HYPO|nr:hypothetical protein VHEMI05677 [[Torrubiella] hemipterigena]
MPPNSAHSRSHSLLLLQKLLNLRDGASPLTLILDTLEQPAKPLISEFLLRSKISGAKTIYLSFTTLRKPAHVDVMIKAAGKDPRLVQRELSAQYTKFDSNSLRDKSFQRAVVIIDSVNSLSSSIPQSLATFLSGILTPVVSIVAAYHTDVPLVLPKTVNEYEPHPSTILLHLATAILRISSLRQEIERQKARNRSLIEPEWGLKEDREGVLIGLETRSSTRDDEGIMISMELRRRSGRTVTDKFILIPATNGQGPAAGKTLLVNDHPMFQSPAEDDGGAEGEEEPESTFNLGLTDKQRKDREGIILPYFDAQTDIGAGEGGRILYEMGREDDFDDEEDEI